MLSETIVLEGRGSHEASSPYVPEAEARAGVELWLADHITLAEEQALSGVVWLTPALAKALLRRNPDNRYISMRKVKEYVADIRAGRFTLNGEAIKISKCGLLNDGQHRCAAVIEADQAIETFITFGLPRASRATLDQGKPRTAGDFLRMDGVDDANVAAATTSLIIQYLQFGAISTHQDRRPTRQQMRQFLGQDDEKKIQESLSFVGRKGVKALGGRSLLAFCHFIFAGVNREAADHFIGKLIKGDALASNSPIFLCRERLLCGNRLKVHEKAKLIFSAWQAFREGRTPNKFVMKGAMPELRRLK